MHFAVRLDFASRRFDVSLSRLALCMAVAWLPASRLAAESVDFVREVRPIFRKHCYACHGDERQKSGLRLDVKSKAFDGGDLYGDAIVPRKPDDSPLIQFVVGNDADLRMPPEGEGLAKSEVDTLTRWVAEGAVWPDGVDLVELDDPLDHWSFQPVRVAWVPETDRTGWSRNGIDRFVFAKLHQEGMHPAPEADRVAWLRRVSFDLTGLPPTPDEVTAFLTDDSTHAFETVVDRLLSSPRYGERWAQHWLDVVRYADTHGFEVNTERPNAWPYRDYVISALNDDTPYDTFVREQLVGDALGKAPATGFLVTASVLLPGQIGKDAPSMRLARQDSLDEIVVNIGQTFLGLSVGCARCHDHKFDPISQTDYYAMQAFVAGVEYADRELPLQLSDEQWQQVSRWKERKAGISDQLAGYQPLARVGGAPYEEPNAQANVINFAPTSVRFVRFTIHDANRHPTLGLIEPCIDEFEIFTSGPEPRNVALATARTKVTASGSRTSAIHRLEHIHDGQYGNSRSWMSDEPGRGWVLFEFPEAATIERVVWGRDREGKFTDRLATAYTLEAGESLDSLTTLKSIPPPRPPINARLNVDRFLPVKTQKLRFTILETNRLEPCIDELEVFDERGENIALASHGTSVTSSGNRVSINRHELRFVNDGQYGNSRSWMSDETGEGWITLEFPREVTIQRVAWGRDREGKFSDRLATKYRIEVADRSDQWRTVAESSDRVPVEKVDAPLQPLPTTGLTPHEARVVQNLLDEQRQLEAKITSLTRKQLVFAGRFREPDAIHLLRRGDPEQPLEPVSPAAPSAIGSLTLGTDAGEQRRRIQLADWIASPDNPLTARVMVNRIWQAHFGMGLVDTPNDLGHNGTMPLNPELLDWLAAEFVRSGWSVKHLNRLVVLSSTYRQTTRNSSGADRDTDVKLLWRYPTRRMDGEMIRDSILAVSGQLSLKMGGPGFNLFDKRGGLTGFNPIETFGAEGHRRMIYAHRVRRERDAVFGAFDCPDAGQSSPRRRESTTPIQALNLLNSRFVLDQSRDFAHRVEAEVGTGVVEQIERAYALALCREPDEDELADASAVVRQHGLATLCRVLLNSNEFLFLP